MKILFFKKLFRAIDHRLNNIYRSIQSFLIALATEKAWLLDFVPPSMAGHNSIMLIRLDVIGDFVLWLDSAKAYRVIYPNKNIVLYANSIWVDLAKHFNYWDEVVSIDMGRLRSEEVYRLKTFFNIRRRGFSIAIQPTYSREYMGDMLTRSSGARQRIGYDCDLSNIMPEQKLISDHWYTQLIRSDKTPLMELQRNTEFVRALGCTTFCSNIPQIPPLVDLPENLKFSVPYIVIFPGASWTPKMWPSSKFAQLIKKLKINHQIDFLFCGSTAEYDLCQQIIDESAVVAQNLAGATKLQELVEVIRNAKLVVANDTSAIHIAAATQTNSVCLLGGGHFGRFLPYQVDSINIKRVPNIQIHKMDCYGCNWDCKYIQLPTEAVPCVANISVEQVYIECSKTLMLITESHF